EEFKNHSIRDIRHESNRGGGVARNTGITNSQGEYVAFLDDDDEWLPEKLEAQMQVFRENSPRMGAVYAGHRNVDRETGKTTGLWRPLRKGRIYDDLMQRNWVGTTS